MVAVSAGIAADIALTQQAVALEVLRQNVRMQQQVAALLQDSVATVPTSGTRGVSVNISA